MNLSERVDAYRTPDIAKELVLAHKPLILCGPTASGKDTIARYLMQQGGYAAVVSDTTRPPRPHGASHEVNGVDYWFIDQATAAKNLEMQAYIEAKLVHGDTLYGTSIAAYQRVVASGRVPVLEIDVQGVGEFMSIIPGVEALFLLPPDFETWQLRLDGRGAMEAEQKTRRLVTALQEFQVPMTDHRFFPVVNTEVVQTAELIESGEYRTPAYRDRALELTAALLEATQRYLSTH